MTKQLERLCDLLKELRQVPSKSNEEREQAWSKAHQGLTAGNLREAQLHCDICVTENSFAIQTVCQVEHKNMKTYCTFS